MRCGEKLRCGPCGSFWGWRITPDGLLRARGRRSNGEVPSCKWTPANTGTPARAAWGRPSARTGQDRVGCGVTVVALDLERTSGTELRPAPESPER